MKGKFLLDYLDESEFKILQKSLKKYCIDAYNEMVFNIFPKLRKGIFVGLCISNDNHNQVETYELQLTTNNNLFIKIYGVIKLNYTVYKSQNVVMLTNLEPKSILIDGHKSKSTAYKGIKISKQNAAKEMFKIDLLSRLEDK